MRVRFASAGAPNVPPDPLGAPHNFAAAAGEQLERRSCRFSVITVASRLRRATMLVVASIFRSRFTWTGFNGAPGVSTFFFNTAPSATEIAAIQTFFNAVKNGIPSVVKISTDGGIDELDEANGELLGSSVVTPPATVTGAAGAAYAAPTGVIVHWTTPDVVGGRRVRGTTYLVPFTSFFDTDGTVVASGITMLGSAAGTLWTTNFGKMVVWHRPKFGPKPPSGPRPLLRDGSSHVVGGSLPVDKAVVLRSRRD